MTKKIYIDKEQVATQKDVESKNTALEAEIKKRPLTVNKVQPSEDGDIHVEIPDISNLVKADDVNKALDKKANTEDVYTKAEVDAKDKADAKSATVNGGEKIMPDENGNLAVTVDIPDVSGFAKTEDVNTALANKADSKTVSDLSDKVTADEKTLNDVKNKKVVYHFASEADGNKFLATDEATDAIAVVEVPDAQ